MKKIVLQIEIDSIEDWDVNWNDKEVVEEKLTELKGDVRIFLASNLGIRPSEVVVSEIKLENYGKNGL